MPMHDMDLSDVWTPKMAGERLIEAVKWAHYNVGPTGPAAVRALMPIYVVTEADRIAEEWGKKESADDDPPPPRKRYKPHEVTALIDVLHWPGRYAVNGYPGSARILNLWLRCQVHKGNFGKAVTRQGRMSRASAYRMRDRALTAIAMGLTNDGIKP